MAQNDKLIGMLNKALGWEIRAALAYAHYAAYIMGRDRLDFEGHFKEESAESMGHAATVRQIISDLGGEAMAAPDATPIPHTSKIGMMLKESLKIEETAEKTYRDIMPLLAGQASYQHAIAHILMSEEKSQIELKRWLK